MSNKRLPKTYPTLRVGKLDTLADVRSELGKLYRQARINIGDGVLPADASKLAHILSRVSELIKDSDLEARIAVIEEQLGIHK